MGDAVGFAIFVALSPSAGDHEYETPPEAPRVALEVVQFNVASLPAFAVGFVSSTVTSTSSEAVHPLAPVTVTVYLVVTDGVAVGFAIFVALSPSAGDHE